MDIGDNMMIKGKIKKGIAMLGVGLCGLSNFVAAPYTAGVVKAADVPDITIDGDLSEWEGMESLTVSDNSVSEWKMVVSKDRSKLYFCFGGIASTQWAQEHLWDLFTITYKNGTTLTAPICQLAEKWVVPGVEYAIHNGAHLSNKGYYGVEFVLPVNEDGYSVRFAETTVKEADIPDFIPQVEEVEPVYNGIVIDGNYDDWAAVDIKDVECPNKDHSIECISKASCIFDGDYVYLYLQDGATGTIANAGMHSNGRYSIVTDMGRTLTFQISSNNGGMVSGVKDAKVAYFGNEWEVAIPVSALPEYEKSISFGLYLSEPFMTGIMDLQNNDGTAGEFSGIVYDGNYGDWSGYPHTEIEYATSGTQTDHPDGEGALFVDGGTLYGHVVSSMDAHLAEEGGEFSSAIDICFNGDREYNGDKTWNFYPMLVTVAEDGTINWNPDIDTLGEGKYEFYLADYRGEYERDKITNISQLPEHERFFGKMTITVSETVDETEFYVDLERVANFLSYYSDTTVEASDFKFVEAKFGRIGEEFISTAGASSGAYMGIGICMAVTAVVFFKRRYNKAVK